MQLVWLIGFWLDKIATSYKNELPLIYKLYVIKQWKNSLNSIHRLKIYMFEDQKT